MKFLVAPNPFKNCLSAKRIACAIQQGIWQAYPKAKVDLLPLSDGGPGLIDAFMSVKGAKVQSCEVKGPLGKKVKAKWLSLPGKRAVIESAQAIGLERIKKPGPKTAAEAHSSGLGQLILAAAKRGAKEIFIGLGGSACTDGGTGMARELGWTFYNIEGKPVRPGGRYLGEIHSCRSVQPNKLKGVKIIGLCDVKSPLFGKRGAAWVYAPQKGANIRLIRLLDDGLKKLNKCFPPGVNLVEGAGAAGGLGAGLMVFAQAKLKPGAETILKALSFNKRLRACEWLITGEGRLDKQSLQGKLPVVVSEKAVKIGRKRLVFVGQNELSQARVKKIADELVILRCGKQITAVNTEKELKKEAKKFVFKRKNYLPL